MKTQPQLSWLRGCVVYGWGVGCEFIHTWVQIQAPLFTGCVTMGKLLHLSEPQFLYQ